MPEERRVVELELRCLLFQLAERFDVIAHANVVPARNDETQLARRWRTSFECSEARKRLESQRDVLLGFKAVDRNERNDVAVAMEKHSAFSLRRGLAGLQPPLTGSSTSFGCHSER